MAVPVSLVPVALVFVRRSVVELIGLGHAEHVPAQGHPQRGALVVAHHGEVELDLVDSGHRHGHPVHLVGQLIGTGPGRHGQGQLDPGPAAACLDLAQHAGATQLQAQLRLHYGAKRRFELWLIDSHALPRLRLLPGPDTAHPGQGAHRPS